MIKKKSKTILVWGDMHIPHHHKDSIKFLKVIKRKYKPDEVICTGDEVDKHAMSFHDSDPDLLSAGDELNASIKILKQIYKLFPKVIVLDSNHGSMLYRKGKHHGIPRKYLRDYNEILESPNSWNWVSEYKTEMGNGQNLFVTHGLEKNSGRFARNMGMCVAQGHYHTDMGIEYSSTPENLIWGASVGCLIDKKSLAFEYNKANLKRPILGCLIIKNGVPKSLPMIVDKDNNWIGSL